MSFFLSFWGILELVYSSVGLFAGTIFSAMGKMNHEQYG
jgi:hypothetical protein